VENSQDFITLLDRAGVIVYTGPSTPRVLGYSEEEYTGRSIFDFMHPDHLDASRKILAQLVENPKTVGGGSVFTYTTASPGGGSSLRG